MSFDQSTEQVQTDQVVDLTKRSRASKRKGASFETQIVNWLRDRLDDDRIERRRLEGVNDRGDVAGLRAIRGGRVVAELKNVARMNLGGWVEEAETERGNDDAVIGVVIHKRRGKGDPADQYVTMTVEAFARFIEGGPDLGGAA